MLDDNPVLKERLMACGAFAGIALFAVMAVDTMITGGFDFGAERASRDSAQPSAYMRVVDAANYVTDRVSDVSWDETFAINSAAAATPDDLAGENDGSPPPEMAGAPSEQDIHHEIAALYEREPEAAYVEDTSYPADDAYYDDETTDETEWSPENSDKSPNASGNASPW